MEPVDAGQEFPALVDYAHTDAALEAALRALRELVGGARWCWSSAAAATAIRASGR